ncbi:hypothetical protein DPMN_054421 [Dreissena polymorpha]|uniref:Uncharacterized protein n=1 Tax=Dreissena polymorpha TaxID=45954 RepID=A0A9D4CN48_DREPO|nr:hypothetical protein DPMN_054421 [Dreissena polymorpha]
MTFRTTRATVDICRSPSLKSNSSLSDRVTLTVVTLLIDDVTFSSDDSIKRYCDP